MMLLGGIYLRGVDSADSEGQFVTSQEVFLMFGLALDFTNDGVAGVRALQLINKDLKFRDVFSAFFAARLLHVALH